MKNGMKLQVKLKSHHDYILVLSYVFYNNCKCVLTVKDKPDRQTFELVWSQKSEKKITSVKHISYI